MSQAVEGVPQPVTPVPDGTPSARKGEALAVGHPGFPRLISGGRMPDIEAGLVGAARAEPPVRGEGLLRRLELLFVRLNRLAASALPDTLNPFAQLGAVANTTLVIALVTGVLLLFWYVPSVHRAFDSVAGMEAAPLTAGLLRSLHRYSSDACMLFVLLHAFQTLFARKVGGARWLGWISGLAMAGLLWLDGWTGYWLVWDERAQQVALGSARFLDALPIFSDPISRSFLTDETVNSLFFFVVFFIHMLIPLGLGVGLWVHVMRLNQARFLTGRALTAAIVLALAVVSLLFPATSAGRAQMAVVPQDVSIDWYYLLPLFLTDRLQGGVLWTAALLVGVVLFSAPWWIARRRPVPAVVDEARCNGCTQCYQDCPFNAIALLPREGLPREGEAHAVVARVDPLRCVGCGVCVGACDSNAVDQAHLPAADVRRWLNHQAEHGGEGKLVAFVCAGSAGADLQIDARGESETLPGYRIVPVPCTGWVHMLTVERALRRGAPGVLLVGCGPDPACRTGDRWTAARLSGEREPFLRTEKVAADRVRHVRYDRSDRHGLIRAAAAFREGRGEAPRRRRVARFALAALLAAALDAATLLPGRAPYRPPQTTAAELVVSFKHAGQFVEAAAADQVDQEGLLPHMRATGSMRRVRVPVRLSVSIDGDEVLHRILEPGGLFDDGSSIAMERVAVPEGRRRVAVRIGDTGDKAEWTYVDEQVIDFRAGERRVVRFDRISAFSWH